MNFLLGVKKGEEKTWPSIESFRAGENNATCLVVAAAAGSGPGEQDPPTRGTRPQDIFNFITVCNMEIFRSHY